jgi:hypothetical protein
MTTMIERMARAAYAKNAAAALGRLPWAKAQEATKESVRGLVRAALEEMRTNTAAMCKAGREAIDDAVDVMSSGNEIVDFRSVACWQAMIDAALKEES